MYYNNFVTAFMVEMLQLNSQALEEYVVESKVPEVEATNLRIVAKAIEKFTLRTAELLLADFSEKEKG